MYHLRRGDFSRWFRESIHDEYLANEAEGVERATDLEPTQTREWIKELVNARYTLPDDFRDRWIVYGAGSR